MKTFWHRFFHKPSGELIHPMATFFVFLNGLYGLLFIFGELLPSVPALKPYYILNTFVPGIHIAPFWGALLILVFIGHCFATYYKEKPIGTIVAMFGFSLWAYAFIAYTGAYVLLGFVSPAIMFLYFWAWYYIAAGNFKKQIDAGEIEIINQGEK